MLEEGRADAEQTLRREAVLAAIVEAEELEPSDEDVLEALQASGQEKTSPKKLRRAPREGRPARRPLDDLRQRKALDLIAEYATANRRARSGDRRSAAPPRAQSGAAAVLQDPDEPGVSRC